MSDAERADDTLLPLRVWLALFSSVKQVEGIVRKNLRATFSSTLPRFDLLSQLYRSPDGLTMGELSNLLMVTNGNVTGLISRLVGEGLVDRFVDADDRRIQRVSLSKKGRRLFDSMAPANGAWIRQAMAGMSAEELELLHTLLTKLKISVGEASALSLADMDDASCEDSVDA